MVRSSGLIMLFFLSACQGSDNHQAAIDDLRLRVEVLEQGQQDMVQEMRAGDARATAVRTAPVARAVTYKLVGSDVSDAYPTKQRCEAAKATIEADRARSDIDNRARGVVFTNWPLLSCVPQ